MTDQFEPRLDALFAQAPRFDDSAAFARGVEQRLVRGARWRADLIAAAWVVTGGAALWAIIASLDGSTMAMATAQAVSALVPLQSASGIWLLPALAIGGALAFQAVEDRWARD